LILFQLFFKRAFDVGPMYLWILGFQFGRYSVYFNDFFVQDPFARSPRFSSVRHQVKIIHTEI
jgi:hypothetical protein